MTVKQVLDGTPTTVISLTANLADGVFAGGSTVYDNSAAADLWPRVIATLSLPDGFTGGIWWLAPAIELWMVRLDVDGTNDELAPSTTEPLGASLVGLFNLHAHATIATPQFKQIYFDIPGVELASFYMCNKTGRSASYVATAITLKIEGISERDV